MYRDENSRTLYVTKKEGTFIRNMYNLIGYNAHPDGFYIGDWLIKEEKEIPTTNADLLRRRKHIENLGGLNIG